MNANYALLDKQAPLIAKHLKLVSILSVAVATIVRGTAWMNVRANIVAVAASGDEEDFESINDVDTVDATQVTSA